jgi:hypothetical protein
LLFGRKGERGNYESFTIHSKTLRKVQGRSPERPVVRYLRKPKTQAATRVKENGTY